MVANPVMDMAEDRRPKVGDIRASVRYSSGGHCIAWYENVQLVLSRVAPDMPAMTAIADQLEQLDARSVGGTGCLLVIRNDVAPPPEDVREFIRMKLEKSSMLAAAQVVLGKGFRGAAMRSVLSVLQLAIRPKYAMRIFGDVRSGCDWLNTTLQERGGKSPSPDLLARVAEELVGQIF